MNMMGTCIAQKLSSILGPDLTKECLYDHKEAGHLKVMEEQKEKYERLWHRKQHSGKASKNMKKVATQNRSKTHQSRTPQHGG